MMPLFALSFLFVFVSPGQTAPLTRQEVVDASTPTVGVSITVGYNNLARPILHNGKNCDGDSLSQTFSLCEGDTYLGEAYKWGGIDSTTTYVSSVLGGKKLVYSSANRNSATSYTGVDCSGFVAPAWGLNWTAAARGDTTSLFNLSWPIPWRELKRGDALLRFRAIGDNAHVVLLTHDVLGSTVSISHATAGGYLRNGARWRATHEDGVILNCVDDLLCQLGSKKDELVPVSPFPLFSAFTPADSAVVGSSRPTVSATITSATTIDTNSSTLKLKIDGVERGPLSIMTQGAHITVSTAISAALSDGIHTMTLTARTYHAASGLDLIDTSTIAFTVNTGTPNCSIVDQARDPASNAPVLLGVGSDSVGVCSIVLKDPAGATLASASFSSAPVALLGPIGPLISPATGAYSVMVTDCAGNVCQSTASITPSLYGFINAAWEIPLPGYTPSNPYVDDVDVDPVAIENGKVLVSVQSTSDDTCNPNTTPEDCDTLCNWLNLTCATSCEPVDCFSPGVSCHMKKTCDLGTVTNTTYYFMDNDLDIYGAHDPSIQAEVQYATGTIAATAGFEILRQYDLVFGTVTVDQPSPGSWEMPSDSDDTFFTAYFDDPELSTQAVTPEMEDSERELVLRQLGEAYAMYGSDFVFTSTVAIEFIRTPPPGVIVDTMTLALYRFDGTDWSSSAVTGQSISMQGSSITVTGGYNRSGVYALFFTGHDSSAPVTTFGLMGSSFAFDGTVFVSTDAYAVLASTDPEVNGFASQVKTLYYGLDASTDTATFTTYIVPIPLPFGTHTLSYYAVDYAGNEEAVRTATFTVTAGARFRNTSAVQANGVFLDGYVGSGAKLEVVSQPEHETTVLVSSANRSGMVYFGNAGALGIGVPFPAAYLDISPGDTALQLRSGNSTSTISSAQLALGYNGNLSYNHILRTEHSTATAGNKMDFLVWNPAAGSTTTPANLNVMSLQGIAAASNGSFHVHPAGEPDVELEVSDGATTGGGTIEYGDLVTPSSRRFKTDITSLGAKDEARALQDVAALRHVRFRYKRLKSGRLIDDLTNPLMLGLIYEDAPESIRAGAETLSSTERLANVELALKAAMHRLEALQRRYERLKARRSTP